jgi:hypothetical protein
MSVNTHAVFWLDEYGIPQVQFFTDLTLMLNFSLERHKDVNCRFVTSASEMPDCVSLSGIDVTGPEYDWKKRRK